MAVCSFFCPAQAEKADRVLIRRGLIYLILQRQVDLFYLSGKSNFEKIVQDELLNLQKQYSYIGFATVLHKAPTPTFGHADYSNTICLPCYAFPSYAERNVDFWMINRSNYIMTYMPHLNGSAAYFKNFLEKKGKILFNLADSKQKTTLLEFY